MMSGLQRSVFVLFSLVFAVSTAPAASQHVLFVFDASGSMWAEMEGGHRISVARDVMREVVGQLPEDSQAGLIAYGHNRRGDCDDIETLIPMGPLGRAAFIATVDAINPRGMTPITASIEHAVELVRTYESAVSIVLISDGLENCGGDPCGAVRAAINEGLRFQMHVVGFAMGSEDISQLQCMAEEGGGRYVAADSAAELNLALATVLAEAAPETVPEPEAIDETTLVIGVVRHGMPEISGTVKVIDLATERELVSPGSPEGWLGRAGADNPRGFAVPPGRYDILVEADGIQRAARWLRGLEIAEGEVSEQIVDFTPGRLTVAATGNGELLERATVTLLDVEDDSAVIRAGSPDGWMGHTGRPHPRTWEILPGIYDLLVKPDQVLGAEQWIRGLEITPGQSLEQTLDFAVGQLTVEVSGNGERMERGNVSLVETGDGRTLIAAGTPDGWMGHTGRPHPRSYLIPAGVYDLWLQAPDIEGAGLWLRGIEIVPGKTVEQNVDFAYGTLSVAVRNGAELVPEGGYVSVVRLDDGVEIISRGSPNGWIGHTGRPHPRTYLLPPGRYDIWLGSGGDGRPGDWIREVELRAGESVEQSLDVAGIQP